MAISIGRNILSLKVKQELDKNSSSLSKVYERLSSGSRINHASDDAVGMAIATSLNADTRKMTVAIRNANDGISMLSTADSGLSALSTIVTRINELAEQASNGVYSNSQRSAMDNEAQQLAHEYSRIISTTKFNGQNLLDGSMSSVSFLVGTDSSQNSLITASLASLVGTTTGTGQFGNETVYSAGGFLDQVGTGDFNGDGNVDVVTAGHAGADPLLFFGKGDGTFNTGITLSTGIGFGVSVGDINNDGKSDIVMEGGHTAFISNGDGTFVSQFIGGNGTTSKLVDFNNDGSLDIVGTSSGMGLAYVFINNGNGTFAAAATYALPSASNLDLTTADFNADGKQDIVVTTSGTVSVLLNNGNGTFGAAASYAATGGTNLSLGTGDFNSDGKQDILVSGSSGYVELLLGNGNGTFAASLTATSVDDDGGYLTVADFNSDGKLDFARAGAGAAKLFIHLGNGDGTFQVPQSVTLTTSIGTLHNADVNADGVSDILMATSDGNLGVFIQGTENSEALATFTLSTQSGARSALAISTTALDQISQARGKIGAFMARLEVASNNLKSSSINYRAAESRITDIDVAQETAELTRLQILQQTSNSLLAQANQAPAVLLQLLRVV